jgi:cytochrome c oxidase subunit 4
MSHSHNPPRPVDHGEIVAPGAKEAHAHHGHIIVAKRTLVAVLLILMTFTALTVFAANAEAFIAHAFGVEIPQWVNVAVALSIAVVKSIIVAAYFMQLRYDNPMNTAIAIFTLMVVCCFLGFTMIDLGARAALEPIKAELIVTGGTGDSIHRKEYDPIKGERVEVAVSGPIALFAQKRSLEVIEQLKKAGIPQDQWPKRVRRWAEHYEHDAHAAHNRAPASSSAQQSRPRTGLTLPELVGPAGAHDTGGHDAAPTHEPAAPAAPTPDKPAH